MASEGKSLLQRVAASLARGAVGDAAPAFRSILTQAATSYAKRPTAAESSGARLVAFDQNESAALMVNEEDHLRMLRAMAAVVSRAATRSPACQRRSRSPLAK